MSNFTASGESEEKARRFGSIEEVAPSWFEPSTQRHPMTSSPYPSPLQWNTEVLTRAEQWDRAEAQRQRKPFWRTPLLLYSLTWFTTLLIGELQFGAQGYLFSIGIMTILTFHEMGHYIQTRRYGVSSSLPYFIPMPFPPFGTMGAIIRMDGRIPNMKALFDIGISGPLAGLVPAFLFCWIGISFSHLTPRVYDPMVIEFHHPLIFQWITYWKFGPLPADITLRLHPLAFAGWVGLFITSLNLLPIGQLDGGHIFYGLLGKRAGFYSTFLFFVLVFLVFAFQLWFWSLMLVLMALMGTRHQPTQDDTVPLGPVRKILGVLTLSFLFIGFTPVPLREEPSPQRLPKSVYAMKILSIHSGNHGNTVVESSRCSALSSSKLKR